MMEINLDSGVDPTQQFVCNVDFHPMEWNKINNSMPVSDEALYVHGNRWNSPHFFFPEKVTHPIIRESSNFNGFLLFGNWKNVLDIEFPTNYAWTFANCVLFDKGIGKYTFVPEGYNEIDGYTYIDTINYGKGNIYSIYIQNDSKGFFTFNEKTMNTSHMFENCQSLNIFNKDDNSLTNIFLNTGETSNASYMFANSYMAGSSRACLGQSNTNVLRVRAHNASGMFYNCRKFDCSNRLDLDVVDGSYMFYGCTNLGALGGINLLNEISGLPLHAGLTNASHMFDGCTNFDLSPARFNLSGYGLTQILDASYMFAGCASLTGLSFNIGKHIKNTAYMFAECYNLDTITPSSDGGIINASGMFLNCRNFDAKFEGGTYKFKVDRSALDISRMFEGCNKLNFGGSYDDSIGRVDPSAPIDFYIDQDDISTEVNASYIFCNCRNLNMESTIKLYFRGRASYNLSHAFYFATNFNSEVELQFASNLSHAFFESNYNIDITYPLRAIDCSYMFAKYFDLHHSAGTIFKSFNSTIDLTYVHNIAHMFDNAETFDRLLDFSGEDVAIEDMSGLFYGNWSTFNHDIFVPNSCINASMLFGVWTPQAGTGQYIRTNIGARNFVNRNIYISPDSCNVFGLLPAIISSSGIIFNVYSNDPEKLSRSNIIGTETTWAQLSDGSYVNYYYGVKLWNYWPEEIILH